MQQASQIYRNGSVKAAAIKELVASVKNDSALWTMTQWTETECNKKTNLTGGQTYNLGNIARQYHLTFLPTRRPNAPWSNFFPTTQKILKFYGSYTFDFVAIAQQPIRRQSQMSQISKALSKPDSKMIFLRTFKNTICE